MITSLSGLSSLSRQSHVVSSLAEFAAGLMVVVLLVVVVLFRPLLRYRQTQSEREVYLRRVFGSSDRVTQLPY